MTNLKINKQIAIFTVLALVLSASVTSVYWYLNPRMERKGNKEEIPVSNNQKSIKGKIVKEVEGVYKITVTDDPDFYELDNIKDKFKILVPASWDIDDSGAVRKEKSTKMYNSDLSYFFVKFEPYSEIRAEVNTKTFKQDDVFSNFDNWVKYKDEYQYVDFINPEGMGEPIIITDYLTTYKGFKALSFVPSYNPIDDNEYIPNILILYNFDYHGEKLGTVEFLFDDDVYSKDDPTPIPLRNQDFAQDKLYNKINDSLVFY